jgi:hypothetical protein
LEPSIHHFIVIIQSSENINIYQIQWKIMRFTMRNTTNMAAIDLQYIHIVQSKDLIMQVWLPIP